MNSSEGSFRDSPVFTSSFKSPKNRLPASPLTTHTTTFQSNGASLSSSITRKWKLADFEIGRNLGKGTFGAVYVAREKNSRFVTSLKILYKSSFTTPQAMRQLCREIDIQSHLLHPNIVRMFDYFYDRKRIYLILEFMPKGNLDTELKRFNFFCDSRASTYVYQLSNAIQYFHSKEVIHRDIKAENILLGAKGCVKIADFGQSIHRPGSNRKRFTGSLDYMPPEVAHCEEDETQNRAYDCPVDIWSLGILTYQMLVGTLPFAQMDAPTTLQKVREAEVVIPEQLSEPARALIRRMLEREPQARITSTDIINHAWIERNAEKNLTTCQTALRDWHATPS